MGLRKGASNLWSANARPPRKQDAARPFQTRARSSRAEEQKTCKQAGQSAFLVLTRTWSDSIAKTPQMRNLFHTHTVKNKSPGILHPFPLLSHLYAPPNDQFLFRVRSFFFLSSHKLAQNAVRLASQFTPPSFFSFRFFSSSDAH